MSLERTAGIARAREVHSGQVAEFERSPRRWRTFADVVAFTLGVNVWVSTVVLPAVFVGALRGGASLAAAAAPLAALVLGLVRRSELVLLGLFPSALLIPISLQPQLASSHVYGPLRFTVVALGVVAYLFGVSYFTTFHEPAAPRSVRPLRSALEGSSERWKRRERVYWLLTALALVFPLVLIGWVNFDRSVADFLGEMYPGRVALMTTAMTVGAIVLWLGIYHLAFLGVLRPHRTGDRALIAALTRARADARAGKPRNRFYAAVAIALGAMMILILVRHL